MIKCDVAIIGGGPAGSTLGSLLRKYNPSLDVLIIEREKFPREHVGESQLPAISNVLNEMGVWDKVEAADFPIKIGATYKWGRTDELWDFEFLAGEKFVDEPRPGKYEGQRRDTAFQVDRSIYDKILLDHAEGLGCRVMQQVKVTNVKVDGDRVEGLAIEPEPGCSASVLSGGQDVRARYYVDCSGESGLMRRALGVEISFPTNLKNIAFWSYWNDAEWAVTLGNGGTRIQVMSLGWGWIWFIPTSPSRTSIGLVLPGDYYKNSGKSKEELYEEAIKAEPRIAHLVRNATQEPEVFATKDWNFISDRIAGENWFLSGDSCGFADPILSAGMTLAHTSARSVAYTILELDRKRFAPEWLKDQYTTNHKNQIRQHMMFADYWYSANGRFTDLKEYCSEIAKTAGLSLDANDAFRWLSTGGFTNEVPGFARASGWRLKTIKVITQHFSGGQSTFDIATNNKFELNLDGATLEDYAVMDRGEIIQVKCFRRGNRMLPLIATFKVLHHALTKESDATQLMQLSMAIMAEMRLFPTDAHNFSQLVDVLESMVTEGWVKASVDPARPFLDLVVPEETDGIHPNRDIETNRA